jgi:hypothetical protein
MAASEANPSKGWFWLILTIVVVLFFLALYLASTQLMTT